MAVITEDAIRELAAFRGEQAPVLTCYLDVDGRRLVRRQDYERELETHVRALRDDPRAEALSADIERIESFVRQGIDRSSTRGLAIFACSAHDLWQVVALPVPVHTRLVVNEAPAVGQLESVLQGLDRFGVLLADKQRARLFAFEFGELVEESALFDELPRAYDDRGQRERGSDAREQHHIDELVHEHLRHAAHVAFEAHQKQPFDVFAIGAPEQLGHDLEAELHPYLRERLCGTVPVAVGASFDEVRDAVLDLETKVRHKREQELVERLRDAVGAGTRGVEGLEPVLRALHDRRIAELVVSEGFEQSGWQCGPCGALATVGRTCPVCREAGMTEVPDVVEEAIEQALSQSVRVHVCDGNADLDVHGRIGALLRF